MQAARSSRAFAGLALLASLAGCAPGHIGEGCRSVGGCVAGAECARPSATGDPQCVALCEATASFSLCPGGEVCYPLGSGDLSHWGCYPGGSTPIGAACTYAVECERGAWCDLHGDAMAGVCVRACNEPCTPSGEPCIDDAPCLSGTCACITAACLTLEAPGTCVDHCTPPASLDPSLCDDGDLCWTLLNGVWACLPPGDVPIGAACTVVNECVQGAVCVGSETSAVCMKVCTTDADCPTGVTCSAGVCG